LDKLLEKFVSLMDEVLTLKDPLSLIIRTHLYLEYYIDEVIRKKFKI
jgi:hypothetical protein